MRMATTGGNLEEDSGVIKSGPVIAGFAPIKSRKTYYAVLCERALELHDSEKTYRKRKSARHLIDLSIAFNLHNDHYDPKLKRCVCLMGPDETLCLKVDDAGKGGDDGRQNTEWFNAIMSAFIPSRVLRLGRPIQPQEFFECVWDVEVVGAPKLKRPCRNEESSQNICIRLPEIMGPKRLCFYAHTIVLCKRRIEPAVIGIPSSGIPPFHINDFVEIPRKCVAFFGCQERYFLMRLGRGAPMGACELWAQCDNDEVAHDIHNKLNGIIERESEKKKKMSNGVVMPPGLLSMRSHHHRERSHTQPLRQRTSSFLNGRTTSSASATNGVGGRKPSAPVTSSAPLGLRALSMSHGSQTSSINTSRGASLMSIFPAQSPSTPPQEDIDGYQQMTAPSKFHSSPSTSTTEEAENSGGTICVDQEQRLSIGSSDLAECSLKEGGFDRQLSEPNSVRQSNDRCSLGGNSASSVLSMEAIGGLSDCPLAKQDDGYTPMHAAEWNAGGSNSHSIVPAYERYKLEEVRSYVSDSSDSCYSSMAVNGCASSSQITAGVATNPPRAYSFAGRCNLRSTGPSSATIETSELRGESSSGGLVPPQEDPRKRAFSLGSKTLFPRPFRKISQHTSRQQRLSQTSASGASLASSEVSSTFGPSSSSANHLTSLNCSEKDEYSRNRSGSFGSGRSTPYNRKAGCSTARDGADHFVEMDFGSTIGRSGSGSVASVDSPNRSRTSSFGCSARKDAEIFSFPTDLPDSGLTPSQLVLQQAKQNSIDESCDYVSTEAPDLVAVKNALAEAANEHNHAHHITFLSPVDQKAIDLRSSQHFETIEESTSLKSSPCSSRSSISLHDGNEDYVECGRRRRILEDGTKRSVTRGEPSTSNHSTTTPFSETHRPAADQPPELDELQTKPSQYACGLPKRSSVPTLKSHDFDDYVVGLNYAFVQENDLQPSTLLSDPLVVPSSRSRSKSGIVFTHNFEAPKPVLDYASIKPL